MSPTPDPPRTLREEDDATVPPEGFVAVWDDDDIFPDDGPYELDVGGSEDEGDSDFSYGEEENDVEEVEGAVGGETRGRYRVLIQFPTEEQSSSGPSQGQGQQLHGEGPESQVHAIDFHRYLSQEPNEETDPVASEDPNPNSPDSDAQRDIQLTDESLEVISNAMKNFTLPAIPPWASELSEDVWRNRLTQISGEKRGSEKCSRNQEDGGSGGETA